MVQNRSKFALFMVGEDLKAKAVGVRWYYDRPAQMGTGCCASVRATRYPSWKVPEGGSAMQGPRIWPFGEQCWVPKCGEPHLQLAGIYWEQRSEGGAIESCFFQLALQEPQIHRWRAFCSDPHIAKPALSMSWDGTFSHPSQEDELQEPHLQPIRDGQFWLMLKGSAHTCYWTYAYGYGHLLDWHVAHSQMLMPNVDCGGSTKGRLYISREKHAMPGADFFIETNQWGLLPSAKG